jgi:TatD DNase family protein
MGIICDSVEKLLEWPTMLIDSHCHLQMLDLSPYEGSLEKMLVEAKRQGISHFLNVCVDIETFPAVYQIAEDFKEVSASFGIHPNDIDKTPFTYDDILRYSAYPKVIAIGETGLDYYRGDGKGQKEVFAQHIAAAKTLKKPLIIHTRNAAKDTIDVLRAEKADDIGGVIHCFTEDWDFAQKALDLGFYISFSGIVTFKNATDIAMVAQKMPLERLLVETDSPYLAPVPHRGKSNYPLYVKHVAEKIASLRGITLAEIEEATCENFYTLFGRINHAR